MSTTYLSSSEIATHLGLSANTIRSYLQKGLLPEPDVIIGASTSRPTQGWEQTTIDQWQANRPGRGARTDLKHGKKA